MITVLVYEFASGGGFVAAPPPNILGEGRAMRDALCSDLAALGGIAVVAATAGAAAASLPGVRTVSPLLDETADPFLRRHAAAVDAVGLIAPESDGILLDLSRLLESLGVPVIGSHSTAIAVTSSKSRTLRRLAGLGIATVPTWPLDEAPLAANDLWVVKPDRGCGCEGMRRLRRGDLAALTPADQPVIAQPWLDGQAMSLSLLVDDGAVELLSVNRQHIEVASDGALSLAGLTCGIALEPPVRLSLETLARTIVAAIPGLGGFVGVDFLMDGAGVATVLEVNARLTSAYVGLSERLGRNLAAELLRAATRQERRRVH
jgi:predicted ATP-grasp superfamily ATP-dependent carboligase